MTILVSHQAVPPIFYNKIAPMHIINQKVSIIVTITQSCVNNYIQLTKKH